MTKASAGGMGVSADPVQTRIEIVERLLHLFRYERRVYLAATLFSVVLLMLSAGSLLYKGTGGPVELAGLFGSTGIITITVGRLLKMWTDALRMIQGIPVQSGEGGS